MRRPCRRRSQGGAVRVRNRQAALVEAAWSGVGILAAAGPPRTPGTSQRVHCRTVAEVGPIGEVPAAV